MSKQLAIIDDTEILIGDGSAIRALFSSDKTSAKRVLEGKGPGVTNDILTKRQISGATPRSVKFTLANSVFICE